MDARRGAEESVQTLIDLGLRQKEIAFRLDVDEATISHIHTNPDWQVSELLAAALEELVRKVRQERFLEITTSPSLVVLETCNRSGTAVDDSMNADLNDVVLTSLRTLFQGETESPLLPDGVDAVLAKAGTPPKQVYVVLLRALADTEAKLLLAHELEHIVERLREGRERQGYRPTSEY